MAIKNSKVLSHRSPSSYHQRKNSPGLTCIPRSETLIVWTERNGLDMALSFQEAEGCLVIW